MSSDIEATARKRWCACGSHVVYQRAGDEAERSFSRAHRACDETAVVDAGRVLKAMRGRRTLAWAEHWSVGCVGWHVYMGDQDGQIVNAMVPDRATAQAVLQLVITAYHEGTRQ